MPLTVKRKQLVIAEEVTAGSLAAGIGSGANATLLIEDPKIGPNVDMIVRNFVYDSLTKTADAAGLVTGRVSFKTEMRGTRIVDSTALPAWDLILRSCGMRRGPLNDELTIGAITGGPFRHGELVTQAVSSATARVMHDTFTGATSILLEPVTGTLNATGLLTGGSTGATATPSVRTAARAYSWYPWKEVVKQITIASATGGWGVGVAFKGNTSNARGVVWKAVVATDTTIFYKPIRGTFTNGETLSRLDLVAGTEVVGGSSGEAFFIWPTASLRLYEDGTATTIRGFRGNWEFEALANRPVMMTFTGVGIMDKATGVEDATMLTGILYQFGLPPIFEDSAMGFADETVNGTTGEIEPELGKITFNLGNDPQLRIHAGVAGGAVEAFTGTTRAGSGTFDPEATLTVDTPVNYRKKFVNGTISRLRATVGSVDANRFKFTMPGIQFSGGDRGERNGIMTDEMPFICTGGELGNLLGASNTLTSIGGENEIVLTYYIDAP